jgi:hypothetical protein
MDFANLLTYESHVEEGVTAKPFNAQHKRAKRSINYVIDLIEKFAYSFIEIGKICLC